MYTLQRQRAQYIDLGTYSDACQKTSPFVWEASYLYSEAEV